MKREDIEVIEMDTILWDKVSWDVHGEPLRWKIVGNFKIARHNEDYWIRRIELQSEEPVDENQRGLTYITRENVRQLTRTYEYAALAVLAEQLDRGVTTDLKKKLGDLYNAIRML